MTEHIYTDNTDTLRHLEDMYKRGEIDQERYLAIRMAILFKDKKKKKMVSNMNTCRTCRHRERWQCGGSIIQYCAVRRSNRTDNKLLKIKAGNPACWLYEKEEEQ